MITSVNPNWVIGVSIGTWLFNFKVVGSCCTVADVHSAFERSDRVCDIRRRGDRWGHHYGWFVGYDLNNVDNEHDFDDQYHEYDFNHVYNWCYRRRQRGRAYWLFAAA